VSEAFEDAPASPVHAVRAKAATPSMATNAARLLMRFKCVSSPYATPVFQPEADAVPFSHGLKGGGRLVTIR
jgi:hypothetical protein